MDRKPRIAIGVYASGEALVLTSTITSLARNTPAPFEVLLLFGNDFGSSRLSSGVVPNAGAAFNRLVRECSADVYIFLDAGSLVAPGWLDAILHVMRDVPCCGLVGPSTNRSAGVQAAFASAGNDLVANAAIARRRFGNNFRSLGPRQSLENFCLAVRRERIESLGPAAERPDWHLDYAIRASAASFPSLWACSSYVHRAPASSVIPPRLSKPQVPAQPEPVQTARVNTAPPLSPPAKAPSSLSSSSKRPTEPQRPAKEPPASDAVLLTCIMPTYNRRAFIPRSLRCFFRQDYPNLELIVVDDGSDPIADLLPVDPRIRYFRLPEKRNVGAKRNFACDHARGDFVFHWDDDEWYEPSRIRRQFLALQQSKARVSGTSLAVFYHELIDQVFLYDNQGRGASWMGALAYPKEVWRERPFDAVPVAEDVKFISHIPVQSRLDLRDATLYVASIHADNTSPKITKGPYWKPEPLEKIRLLSGFEKAIATDASVASRERN